MVEFAKQIGAMQGSRPYWYAVAEHLAEIVRPDLLKDDLPVSRPVGGPKGNWFDLFTDVNLVMRQKGCKVPEACQHLADGEHPHRLTVHTLSGETLRVRAAMGKWKGRNPRTLRQRYFQCIREWRKTWGKV